MKVHMSSLNGEDSHQCQKAICLHGNGEDSLQLEEDTCQPLIWEDLLQLEIVMCPSMSGEFFRVEACTLTAHSTINTSVIPLVN